MKMLELALLPSLDPTEAAFVREARGRPEDGHDRETIEARTRALFAAVRIVHDAARHRCSAIPGRQMVEVLCEAILAELAQLCDQEGAPDAAGEGTSLGDEERDGRLFKLLVTGQAMAEECEAGAFDGEPAVPAPLAMHAYRLGDRYVELLSRIAIPRAGQLQA